MNAAESEQASSARSTRRRGSRGRGGSRRKTEDEKEPTTAAAEKKTTTKAASDGDEPKPARRTSRRRKADEADAGGDATTLTALIERQTALLEQQQQALAALAEAQTRLADIVAGAEQELEEVQSGDNTVALKPRLAIFVDVPNILYAAERSGVELDWVKVAAFLARGRTLVRAIAYAPISDDPDAKRENERFVLPFMDRGYRIVTKQLKRFSGGSVKANFDVELAIDILTMADRMDVIALVSGDGDFRRLVEIVGSRGVRVEVMAFGQSTSADLRAVADRYIDMAAYVPELSK